MGWQICSACSLLDSYQSLTQGSPDSGSHITMEQSLALFNWQCHFPLSAIFERAAGGSVIMFICLTKQTSPASMTNHWQTHTHCWSWCSLNKWGSNFWKKAWNSTCFFYKDLEFSALCREIYWEEAYYFLVLAPTRLVVMVGILNNPLMSMKKYYCLGMEKV